MEGLIIQHRVENAIEADTVNHLSPSMVMAHTEDDAVHRIVETTSGPERLRERGER